MDNESQVSGQEQVEQGSTTPQFTEVSVVKPASDVDAIVAKAIEKLLPEIDKRVQSTKDRRFSDIEKKLEGLKQLSELEDLGVNIPENVKMEMRLRALESQPASKKDGDVTPSIGDTLAEAKEILSEAKIGTDDPEIVALYKTKTYPNTVAGHAELLKDVTKIAVRRAGNPSPTAAQAAALPGPATPAPSQEGLTLEYQKAMLAARGRPNDLVAIKQKYKKLGVPVDQVVFT